MNITDDTFADVRAFRRKQLEPLAGRLYCAYCVAVGGKAFNGDALPTWDVFRTDPAKQIQSEAWISVASAAKAEFA